MKNRDENGRFAPGGSGGPGRPPREVPPIRPDDDCYADDLLRRANEFIAELQRYLERRPEARDE